MIEYVSVIAKENQNQSGVTGFAQQRPKYRHLVQTPPNCQLFGPLERIVHHVHCADDFAV